MRIPISNTLNSNEISFSGIKLDINKLNQLNFKNINIKKFPVTNIVKILPKNNSLFETVLVTVNDELVNLFLNKKISFREINFKLQKILKSEEFLKYKKKNARKIDDITSLSNYVRSKIIIKGI